MSERTLKRWIVVASLVCLGTHGCGEKDPVDWPWWNPTVLPSFQEICVIMANGARMDDSGVKLRPCEPTAFSQYFIGFRTDQPYDAYNDVHIAQTPSSPDGKVFTGGPSGTFYVTNRDKAKGYTDEAVIMISVNFTDPQQFAVNFSVNIRVSGYQIQTNEQREVVSKTYVPNALDAVIPSRQFVYGPQSWKPASSENYPLWYGQTVSDSTTKSLLVFVDLNVGLLNGDVHAGLTDNGAAKVDYSFTSLESQAAFNAYGYSVHAVIGQGINWTNKTVGAGANGLTVTP